MPSPLSRRALLRASGPALAAALAGCSLTEDEETDTPPKTSARPDETVALSTTTDRTTTSNPTPTTEQCQSGPLEPTVSEGSALIYHQRYETESELMAQSATIFSDRYGTSLETLLIPSSGYWAKLRGSVPQADGPELFEYPHDRAYRVIEFVADQATELRVDPCQYIDVAWDATQFQGKTVGLPVSAQTVGLYYNEAIVDEPPETLTEMQAVMDRYHDPDKGQYGLVMSLNPYFVSGFAQAYGGDIYDEEADELGLTSDAVERGFRVFFEEVAPYAVSPHEDDVEFREGNVAFAIDGPWRLSVLVDSDIEWGVTTLPALPDGGEMRPYMGVKLLYFSKRVVEDPQQGMVARQFAEWYTTNEARLRELVETDAEWVPVYTELVDDPSLPEPTRVFSEQCKRGYPMPANEKMMQVWGPVDDVLRPVREDEQALTEALETAEERIREEWPEDGT